MNAVETLNKKREYGSRFKFDIFIKIKCCIATFSLLKYRRELAGQRSRKARDKLATMNKQDRPKQYII